ncbi:hypothetical protein FRC20_009127 [Serendipita sp. 405]|nr:hypothetical protein FRC20_009127 [Serendipita sp. 405]
MAMAAGSQSSQKPPVRYPIPQSSFSKFLWRKKMWVEATFALSMLERWEKILVVSLFLLVCLLFVAGSTIYLPQHLLFLTRRARFYLLGSERESFYVDWPTKADL